MEDNDLQLLCELLSKEGRTDLSKLLENGYGEIEESGQFGSYLYSVLSSYVIYLPVDGYTKTKSFTEKDILHILDKVRDIYPPRSEAPEIVNIEFRILRKEKPNVKIQKSLSSLSEPAAKIKNLIKLLPEARLYIEEASECCQHGHLRAIVNLVWQIFTFSLYKRIEIFGLKEFVQKAQHNGVLRGGIFAQHDLNKIEDEDLLALCHELGFFDINVKRELINYKNLRNSCSHVTSVNISQEKVVPYVTDLISYIHSFISEGKSDTKTSEDVFQMLLSISEDKIKDEINKMDLQRQKDLLRQCLFYLSYESESRDEEKSLAVNICEFCIESGPSVDRAQKLVSLIRECSTSDFLPIVVSKILGKYLNNPSFRELLGKNETAKNDLIKLFSASFSYDEAGKRVNLIIPLSDFFTEKEKGFILDAILNNSQINGSSSARLGVGRVAKLFVNSGVDEKVQKVKELLSQ